MSANPTKYVAGFMFDEAKRRVLLIRKKNPPWQRGLLNGVGGKIEKDEEPLAAMRRECREETTLVARADLWHPTVVLFGAKFCVYFFYSVGPIDAAQSVTDEKVEVVAVDGLNTQQTIHNLRWLVPMQLDKLEWPLYIHDLAADEAEHTETKG